MIDVHITSIFNAVSVYYKIAYICVSWVGCVSTNFSHHLRYLTLPSFNTKKNNEKGEGRAGDEKEERGKDDEVQKIKGK